VAEWLGLPLLVTEMGVDASAFYTRSYDSYEYGLREARMAQELPELRTAARLLCILIVQP
jgi:hypothetical protein